MGRVCLILPVVPAPALNQEFVDQCLQGLERAGHTVEAARMLDPLASGDAELTVARRDVACPNAAVVDHPAPFGRRLAGAVVGAMARPVLGASDLFSGLVALTPELARSVTRSFEPVG